MPLPSIFNYLDYRAFLREWLQERKRQEPNYTYQDFADAGGCSKAAISNVLNGSRRPRIATIDAFALAMNLKPAERNYFGLLVDFSTARDVETRVEVLEAIVSGSRFQQLRLAERESDDVVFRYAEHWYVPAIRELASLPGFRDDPEWIAKKLCPSIEPKQAEHALNTLFELDFLRRRSDGRVEVREVRFRSEPETTKRAIAHFHRDAIPGLLRQMDPRRGEEQHVLAATMAIASGQVPEFKVRLNTLVGHLATMADDRQADGPYRIYQLAIQLLPVTEPIDTKG
ncbi:MAG: TIGR02147 family protein [Myxococcota bacterium]